MPHQRLGVGGRGHLPAVTYADSKDTEMQGPEPVSAAGLSMFLHQPDVETEPCGAEGGSSGLLSSDHGYGNVLLNSVTPVAAF